MIKEKKNEIKKIKIKRRRYHLLQSQYNHEILDIYENSQIVKYSKRFRYFCLSKKKKNLDFNISLKFKV